jgi:uncharacterized protein (TIGR00304 family)
LLALVAAGILVIFVGLVVLLVGVFQDGRRDGQSRLKGGGVIMIGPIPIIFGSDMKWASIAIILAIVLLLLVLFAYGV